MPFPSLVICEKQEKIARSLIPDSIALGNSSFGRFFAKKLNLPLLERRPVEWREMQLGVVHHFTGPRLTDEASGGSGSNAVSGGKAVWAKGLEVSEAAKAKKAEAKEREKKRKRTKEEEALVEDGREIDDLFAGVVSEKPKKKKKRVVGEGQEEAADVE